MAFDFGPAITRIDGMCDAAHELARAAAAWPAGLREAAAALAHDLELLAGALDGSEDPKRLRAVIVDAREFLPRNFADFGIAIVDDLVREFRATATGRARASGNATAAVPSPRRRRQHLGGDLCAAPGKPEDSGARALTRL